MDPSRFKAPVWSKAKIEERAEEIRREYPSTQKIPVNVLEFAEFDLELELDFVPIQQLGQVAFLRPDLRGMLFDNVVFKEPALQQRLRFSAAHELAHLFLHKDIYGALSFTTVKQWIAFIGAIPAKEYYWIEWQADEFAGHFLMPTARLSLALDESVRDAEREGFFAQGQEEILDFCSRAMHDDFGVSRQAMQTRIRKSKLWPHPRLKDLPN